MRASRQKIVADYLVLTVLLCTAGCISTHHHTYHSRQAALCRAARDGNLETVEQLLSESKLDVNFRFSDGTTPILCAVRGGHPDVVAYLLEQGADPEGDQPRRAWKSPLQRAVEGLVETESPDDWQRIVELLVAHGADPRRGLHGALKETPPFRLQELYGAVSVLNLAHTEFGDADLPRLQGFIRLKQVDLTGTRVTKAGLQSFAHAMPACHCLSRP